VTIYKGKKPSFRMSKCIGRGLKESQVVSHSHRVWYLGGVSWSKLQETNRMI